MKKEHFIRILKKLESLFKNDNEVKKALSILKKKSDQIAFDSENDEPINFPLPKEMSNKDINTYAIFSDGACRNNPGPGAWGAIAQDKNGDILFEVSDFEESTTNNRMELTAAIGGLKELQNVLKNKSPDKTSILLYTDSKYVVDGINRWMAGWKKRGWKKADNRPPENLPLWQELDTLNNHFKSLSFHWVKGHAGHPQNEYCDKLANDLLNSFGL